MTLYSNHTSKLQEVKEKPFKLERDIQKLFEENLTTIMGLELVKSEFTIKNKRIDTLAFDKQAQAFIIIEYKRDKNISVVDQGFTYLSLMLENKADFIVEYNESLKQNLKREDIDWSQTRVAFVSTSFTENQIQATNFKDIAIELWEVKQFENNTITISPIKKSNAAESIKPLTQNKESLKKVTEQIKVYTEQDHLNNGSDSIQELYEKFKHSILQLDNNLEAKPKKVRISFQIDKNIISDISIFKKSLKLWINLKKGRLDDPKKITEDVSEKGHWGNGDYQIQIDNDANLEYIMSLIKQAIEK
jgi:predicted transport protein